MTTATLRSAFCIFLCAHLLVGAPALGGTISLRQDEGVDYILVEGEIEESDVAHFQRLAVSSETAVVVLGSPGGALAPALEIGKIIRLKGFGTYVPEGVECTSACALVWIAGQPRMLSSTSRIGFHASYTVEGGRQLESGLGNAMVGRYLTLLNLPEKAVIFATSAGPGRVEWIDPKDWVSSGIDFQLIEAGSSDRNESIAGAPEESAPIVASTEFSWHGGAWSVLSKTDREGCFAVANFSSEQGEANGSAVSISKDRHESSAGLSFRNDRFRSVREGEDYAIRIYFVSGEALDDGWGEVRFTGVEYHDGRKGLTASLNWDELLEDFRNEEKIGFYLGDQLVDVFPLAGSAGAMRQLEKCLAANVTTSLSDPFR